MLNKKLIVLLAGACSALSVLQVLPAHAQASIDESPFAKGGNGTFLYVSQKSGASDQNPGTSPDAPLATISHAVQLSKDLTAKTPVKIVVGPGVYREAFLIQGGPELLVIEGSEPGKVIVSGSQAKGWELSSWTPVKEVPGLYKKAWPYKLGLVEPMGNDQIGKYPNLAVFRREAVFVNRAGLAPVQLEDYSYDFHADPRYQYKGYRDPVKDPTVIPPGTFAVNDQKDDHPDAHTIFLRLPADVDPATAVVEVPDDSLVTNDHNSKKLLLEFARSNFVMRNMVVEHAPCLYNFAAVGVNVNVFGDAPKDRLRNFLFENCEFTWNNGIGLNLTQCEKFTIRKCHAHHNGNGGICPWSVFSMLLEDNDTSWNAWTAKLSGDGWLPAGTKTMMQDSVVRREISNHNGYIGFWMDFGYRGQNGNNTFEDCDFSYNDGHGLLIEIGTGPNYIKNCRFVGNGGVGLESSYQARQTYVDHCVLINNGNQLNIVAQASGNAVKEGRNGNPDDVLVTKITNSIIASDKGAQLVNFYNDNSFVTDPKGLPGGGSRFQASGNTYWDSTEKEFKVIWWDQNLDFAAWQSKTGQDADSKWEKPDFAKWLTWNPASQKTP